MTDRQVAAHLLVHAGRLLLEYNESSGEIVRTLEKTAEALTEDECHLGIDYHRVLVSLGENGPACPTVKELRYNAAAQMRVHQILDDVRRGDLDAAAALARLGQVEAGTPRHPVWLVALLLGGAAASFGHLLGAAGAVEAIFSILALRDQVCPPTLNLDNPSPGCDMDLVPKQAKQRQIRAVLSNSFGFGGTNASLVFAKPH